jgi:hypothetical protein
MAPVLSPALGKHSWIQSAFFSSASICFPRAGAKEAPGYHLLTFLFTFRHSSVYFVNLLSSLQTDHIRQPRLACTAAQLQGWALQLPSQAQLGLMSVGHILLHRSYSSCSLCIYLFLHGSLPPVSSLSASPTQ